MIIPKVFNLVWLAGSHDRPINCDHFIDRWLALHPDYDLRWWDGTEFELTNQKAFDTCPSVGAKADMLRYEILLREGGIYFDIDVEPFENIERIIEHCTAFVGKQGTGLGNFIMGATPGHEAMVATVDQIGKIDIDKLASLKVSEVTTTTGPDFVHRVLFDHARVTAFEHDYFTGGRFTLHHGYGTWIDAANGKGWGDRIAMFTKLFGAKRCVGCNERGHEINESTGGVK